MPVHLLALNPLDPHSLLASFGPIGVFVVLVAETGLLIGIFLPGDSLLVTAGLLCATKAQGSLHLSLPAVLLAAVAGALVGAQIGYLIGRRAGPALVDERRGPRVRTAVAGGRAALERYGPEKAVVLARFIPLVRTVMNPLMGVIAVPARTFVVWQVVGGVVWSAGVTLAGYALGSHVPHIDTYLLPIIALVVVISLIPLALEAYRARTNRSRA
ncbi:DedA family protein [Actinopolymorpha pittospori]|uniref:Membrane-associated protein n=1 Tax=Actinopolymorpha pittospori TaxID=648752 RepID=A0A927RLP8_9ACTN|nr:DedA family protein [Actinopolymorpha pittospori]MBE1608073.1 membrane-associated protein [Actinopolymorpha pittospori]